MPVVTVIGGDDGTLSLLLSHMCWCNMRLIVYKFFLFVFRIIYFGGTFFLHLCGKNWHLRLGFKSMSPKVQSGNHQEDELLFFWLGWSIYCRLSKKLHRRPSLSVQDWKPSQKLLTTTTLCLLGIFPTILFWSHSCLSDCMIEYLNLALWPISLGLILCARVEQLDPLP